MKFDPLNDGISSVELIDHMGSDLTVVNAARVSMAKESQWEYESALSGQVLSKRDCGLISYLARHKHWTPFSHPQIQLRIKMPIFVARQWFKHMIGFTRNEVSRRYVDDTPEFFYPNEWRVRPEGSVKQGSGGTHPASGVWGTATVLNTQALLRLYEEMIADGVAPEQARMILPCSHYTEFYETGSLAAYARLASLRRDPHAQKETQLYARAVSDTLGTLFPVSWAALTCPEVSTHG
jgi:thymidylate synthase (FAD)